MDGTAYKLLAVEKFQARNKTYRGRSGKTKYKSKTKTVTDVSLIVRPKVKRYGDIQQMESKFRPMIQIPPWSWLKTALREKETLRLVTTIREDWHGRRLGPNAANDRSGPHLVAMMFLSLYQVMHSAPPAKA